MHNSEAADSQEVPKNRQEVPRNRPVFWAVSAHCTGNDCPLLVLSMPDIWSLSAHLTGRDRPLNGF